MFNILDSAAKRRIQMLEILIERDDWVSTKDIAQAISCSERIINNDIRYCNALFRESKILTSQFGIRYTVPPFLGMKRLYQIILEDSVAFRLLEMIFFNDKLNITDLEPHLFISSSALYRMAKKSIFL